MGLNLPQASAPMSGLNATVPPPSILRQEARIQQEVQQRLQDLAKNVHSSNGRAKSQRGGPVDIFVSHRVKWPHEYILSGQNKDRISCNQLSPIQWTSGFCRAMREEQNHDIIDCMLDYVINLLDDAQDFLLVLCKGQSCGPALQNGAGGDWQLVGSREN